MSFQHRLSGAECFGQGFQGRRLHIGCHVEGREGRYAGVEEVVVFVVVVRGCQDVFGEWLGFGRADWLFS